MDDLGRALGSRREHSELLETTAQTRKWSLARQLPLIELISGSVEKMNLFSYPIQ